MEEGKPHISTVRDPETGKLYTIDGEGKKTWIEEPEYPVHDPDAQADKKNEVSS